MHGCRGAVLIQADSARDPIATRTCTVTSTVIVAGCLGGCFTIICRVLTGADDNTVIVVSGTDLAERTVILGVTVERVEGTGTFAVSNVAGLTAILAGSVAAVTVDAVVGEALVAGDACLPIVLLRSACIAQAVEDRLTVIVVATTGQAVVASFVADVGYAELRSGIDTASGRIAEVIRVEGVADTSLLYADSSLIPVLT